MPKKGGFLQYKRSDIKLRPRTKRLRDFKYVEVPFIEEEIKEQAARCMECGIPFCHGMGCSLANIIPEFNDHVYEGRYELALRTLLATNCFPEFTGRVCPAPCEGSCVLGLNDDPVMICKIELFIIEEGFRRGFVKAEPPSTRYEQSVAVVGSGPAGLAAAQVLNKAGYGVIVYENRDKPGGILRYGIPDFKLEKWVLDRRIRLMREEGIFFETGVEVGSDLSHRYLSERFSAVLLAGGAQEPRELKVPGRDLDGIHFAMDFLIQQNKRIAGEPIIAGSEISAQGKNVVIIGGGDTGSDCLGTALRQGARRVYQFEIMPKPPTTRAEENPWPEWPVVLKSSSSHKEGGERRFCIATKEFKGKNGALTGLVCEEVEWRSSEPGGPKAPVVKEGSQFTVDAELVLLAMGFVSPGENKLVDELGLERDGRGFIKKDGNYMTNEQGVFVAGDMTRGPSLVVHAISEGMQAAGKIIDYLKNQNAEKK